MVETRPVSGMERLWLVGERLSPGFHIELVLEGRGLPRPAAGWPALLRALAQVVPASRARLVGALGWARWQADGPLPRVAEVDLSGWSGLSDAPPWPRAGACDPRQGPLVQVLLAPGDPDRLVLRAHHGLVDGRGLLLLARTLFALLRGESPPASPLGGLTDAALARDRGVAAAHPPRRDCAGVGGASSTPDRAGTTWRRIRVEGHPPAVLARTLVALARLAAVDPQGEVRLDLPVDLRRHLPADAPPRTANLTGILRLPMRALLGQQDPVAATRQAVAAALARDEAAATVLAAGPARWLPVGLMAALSRGDSRHALAEGRYASSALVSNFGQVDLASLSGGGFLAHRAFVITPSHPGLPLFLAMLGTGQAVELCAVVPRALAGSLDGVEAALRRGLGG
ncbi:hypothetical protein L6R53_18130 [Myxococcota bacterium]|nr:hypothetical protein [Myxococcota bacterium]